MRKRRTLTAEHKARISATKRGVGNRPPYEVPHSEIRAAARHFADIRPSEPLRIAGRDEHGFAL